MKLLDSAESVPTFNYTHTFGGRDHNMAGRKSFNSGGKRSKAKKQPIFSARKTSNIQTKNDAVVQLETVLTSMFKVLNDDVEPFIADRQT